MSYFVYVIRTSGNTIYTGQTNNLEKRLKEHKNKTKKAAKYLRRFSSFKLVYKEEFLTKSEALRRECQIKKLSKAQKEILIGNIS